MAGAVHWLKRAKRNIFWQHVGLQMSFNRMLQTSMHVHQKDALNIHAYASPDHYFVCLAFARSPKKIQVYQCLYVYIYIYNVFMNLLFFVLY